MASRKPTLQHELAQYNDSLDACLRSRYGMTLKLFKLVKAITQLVGAGAGVYAMSLGAPPLAALAMMTVMIAGPEGLEFLIERGSA
ncbi:hypothetical protein NDI56_04040 [Haloarcula sp. S1CR25-12]|uniref:Uncharacterized protein n=1 Tax=Haloarcula saliterrae TaxID=2950534 RepID=A0ABU2F8M8_9EURY|nr:hypothetical protein [Haloarcula sp. S1CR25-12]MDS0258581.1 hypothetical protein [Haloarcula sp. S1CR25-12]